MKRKWIGLTVAFVLILGMVLLYVFGPATAPMPLWKGLQPKKNRTNANILALIIIRER